MICKGRGGSLELRDDCVVIRRTMVLGLLNHGLAGEKRIPYSSISAVQFKHAGVLVGYIQFTIPGGVENTKGLIATMKDENSLDFTENDSFEKARDLIEKRMREARSPYVSPPPQGGTSMADQLEKLASLLEKGLLTQQEFDVQKAALLNMSLMATPPNSPAEEQTSAPEPIPDPGALRMQAAMDEAIAQHQSRTTFAQPAPPSFGKRRA